MTTNNILADRKLRDLIAQLTSAHEALCDTLGMLIDDNPDDNPDSADLVIMNNVIVARDALDTAADYLADLRENKRAS
jgi:hypothetical protein